MEQSQTNQYIKTTVIKTTGLIKTHSLTVAAEVNNSFKSKGSIADHGLSHSGQLGFETAKPF